MNMILVAADDSPLSKRAFEQTLAHADSTAVALHVIDPSDSGYSAPLDADISAESPHGSEEWCERADELADDIFDGLVALANGSGIELRTETPHGNPARTIVDFACREGVDAVYLDGHGRTGETDLLFGSVAELVASRVPTSVLVIRRVHGGSLTSRSSPASVTRHRQPAARAAPECQRA